MEQSRPGPAEDVTSVDAGNEEDGDQEVTVLVVDPDQQTRDAVSDHFEEAYEGVNVVTTETAEAAVETAGKTTVDCLVTETDVSDEQWERLTGTVHCPVVLYTAKDPREIPRERLRTADTLVTKSDGDQTTELLARKVFGVRRDPVERWERPSGDSLGTVQTDGRNAVGAFLVDGDGRVQWSNASLQTVFPTEDLTASVPEEASFYTRVAAFLGDDPEAMRDVLLLEDTDDVRRGEVLEIPTTDEPQYFLHYSYPVPESADGARLELVRQVTDVVDRYDRLDLFEQLVENAEDGLYVLDSDARVVYLNDSFADLLGYDREELLGTHASQTMAEGELQKGQELLARLLETGAESEVIDLTFTTKDGQSVDCAVHFSVRTEDGQYAGLMGVVRDITERKERERELEEYRKLVESAADPMYVLDEDGTIRVLNSAMADFFGHPKSELVGADAGSLLPDQVLDRGRQAIRDILSVEGKEFDSFETWLEDAEGAERRYEVTIGVVTEGGEFDGSVATFRDISERHRQRTELELLKQVFSRALRHNIRNKASVIQSNVTMLADETVPADDDRIAAIRRASESLATTSDKVKLVDRIVEQDPDVVEHDLSAVLRSSYADAVDANPEASVTVEVPDGLRVLGIPDLEFAFYSLFENALVHGTEANETPNLRVTATQTGGSVRVTIEDDGPGIPESEVEVLEQQQETALEHASGIGLWLTERVVSKSGGDLAFEIDDGTRAIVELDAV